MEQYKKIIGGWYIIADYDFTEHEFKRVECLNDSALFYFSKNVLGEFIPIVFQFGQLVQAMASFCSPYKVITRAVKLDETTSYKYDGLQCFVYFTDIDDVTVHCLVCQVATRGSIMKPDGYSVTFGMQDQETGEPRTAEGDLELAVFDLIATMDDTRE